MRCLANAMLLKPEARKILVGLDYEPEPGKSRLSYLPKLCAKLKTESWDDEFLAGRILFLTTYGTDVDLVDLVDQHQLAENLVEKLARHARQLTLKSKPKTADPVEGMALAGTLKLMFNVTEFCPTRISAFSPAIPHIISLMWKQDVSPSKPLGEPFGDIVNALLNLDVGSKDVQAALFPKDDPNRVCQRLLDLLGHSINVYSDGELEVSVVPLIGVISNIYNGPLTPASAKEHLRSVILPAEEDRNTVLGKGETLASRLLRNSTNPMTPHLQTVIQNLMFDMSDQDAAKFASNVGYGFASGFLFQRGIPMPSSGESATDNGPGSSQRAVNPITGQFLDAEAPIDDPEMTEEEKEQEAEKLFVLFERYVWCWSEVWCLERNRANQRA